MKRPNVYDQLEETRLKLRRTQRGARWLGESRDYWRERARAAEWGLGVAARKLSTVVDKPVDRKPW